jgi:hypothetical protein
VVVVAERKKIYSQEESNILRDRKSSYPNKVVYKSLSFNLKKSSNTNLHILADRE